MVKKKVIPICQYVNNFVIGKTMPKIHIWEKRIQKTKQKIVNAMKTLLYDFEKKKIKHYWFFHITVVIINMVPWSTSLQLKRFAVKYAIKSSET